jgi:UDP-N-acetyl-D-glucosamine/UDP-N-acetyl-D-galactosamine dehydrogenase
MEKVAVVGLGYVGLPVALGFARKVDTVGFDIDAEKYRSFRAVTTATARSRRMSSTRRS